MGTPARWFIGAATTGYLPESGCEDRNSAQSSPRGLSHVHGGSTASSYVRGYQELSITGPRLVHSWSTASPIALPQCEPVENHRRSQAPRTGDLAKSATMQPAERFRRDTGTDTPTCISAGQRPSDHSDG